RAVPRRQHAVVGAVRAAAAVLSGRRDSSRRHGSGIRGAGERVRVDRYVGPEGARIGMETFGASAPLQELQKKFGFTVEHVVAAARAQLERKGVGSHAS